MNEDKATRYHRLKRRARVAGVAGAAALLLGFWASGASAALRVLAERGATALGVEPPAHAWLVVGLYALTVCIAAEVIALPLAAYGGHVLERRYGLSTQTFRRWLWDHAKASALGVLLGVAAASVAYALLRWSPSWWWIPTGLAFTVGSVVLAFLAPVLLFPLFFRLRPLQHEALVERLVSLARRAGAPVLGVYEWHLGERTRAANAALVGLAGTRRILVSDTLLSAYSEDEIEVILAHELSHHVHGDLWKALALDAVLTVGALLAGHLALGHAAGLGGVAGGADVAGLPVLLLAAAAWSTVTAPLANAVSRAHERRADRFALDLTRNPDAFVAAMRRLGAQNLADEQPSRVTRWLFHSHPTLPERVGAARAWMSEHAGA
jgi:STE24 endopeptidase